jgi:hypothetical protein
LVGTAGGAAGGATSGTSAPPGTAGAASGAPAIAEPVDSKWTIPPPPVGITASDPSLLPEGVWLGESRMPLACGDSQRIALQIAPGASGEPAQGTIVFGEGAYPSSLVDPEQAYPVGADHFAALCSTQRASEGYPYSVFAGQLSSSDRFDFRVAILEPYVRWCALQTSQKAPAAFDATGYSCLPSLSHEELVTCQSQPEHCPIPSGKFQLCQAHAGACLCLEDGCSANLNVTHRFDLRVDGTVMEGLVSPSYWSEFGSVEVRLQRVE